MKDIVSVIDFGSSRITLLTGQKEVNNSFKVLSSVEVEYDGFASGEFVDQNSLKSQIAQVINDTEKQLQFRIGTLFVGVPAEFCFVTKKLLIKTFNKKTKITAKIIDELFLDDKEENPYTTHSIINKAPMYYIINEDNKTNDPLGQYAFKLQAKTSYILVENKFKMLISAILDECGIKTYDFFSDSLAESVYLIDDHKRYEGAYLVDCGFVTTSVSQVLGDGLVDLKSFSMGGGFITADLTRVLGIDYDEGEELKSKVVLTLKPNGVDAYILDNGKKFGVKNVNEIILARLDKIIEMIKSCMSQFEAFPEYIPILFTGGGINYFEGIKDYLRKEFSRPIELVKPKALLYARPDLSSAISLLNTTINL